MIKIETAFFNFNLIFIEKNIATRIILLIQKERKPFLISFLFYTKNKLVCENFV